MKSSVIVVGTLAIVLVFFVGSVVVLQQLGKIQDESTFSAPILSTSDDSSDFAVTLVTQSSPERLWLLRETCLRWRGPIVLVAFVRSEDTADSESHLYIPLQNGTKGKIGSTVCPNVEVVTYHPALDGNDPSTSRYPVNKLRNIGIAAVRTSHFLYLDIDFWPSSTIEQHLAQFHKHEPYRKIFEADKSAVVVPAFNFLAISNGCLYADTCRQTYQRNAPRTFHQLRQCLDERRCQVSQPIRGPSIDGCRKRISLSLRCFCLSCVDRFLTFTAIPVVTRQPTHRIGSKCHFPGILPMGRLSGGPPISIVPSHT